MGQRKDIRWGWGGVVEDILAAMGEKDGLEEGNVKKRICLLLLPLCVVFQMRYLSLFLFLTHGGTLTFHSFF